MDRRDQFLIQDTLHPVHYIFICIADQLYRQPTGNDLLAELPQRLLASHSTRYNHLVASSVQKGTDTPAQLTEIRAVIRDIRSNQHINIHRHTSVVFSPDQPLSHHLALVNLIQQQVLPHTTVQQLRVSICDIHFTPTLQQLVQVHRHHPRAGAQLQETHSFMHRTTLTEVYAQVQRCLPRTEPSRANTADQPRLLPQPHNDTGRQRILQHVLVIPTRGRSHIQHFHILLVHPFQGYITVIIICMVNQLFQHTLHVVRIVPFDIHQLLIQRFAVRIDLRVNGQLFHRASTP